MKKKTMMFLLVGMFTLGINAKGKNSKRLKGGHVITGQVMAQRQIPTGIMQAGVAGSNAVQPGVTDQQFLQEQLFGMQNVKIAELKSKIMAIKAKNAENKKIIGQGLIELVSGPVILYKK